MQVLFPTLLTWLRDTHLCHRLPELVAALPVDAFLSVPSTEERLLLLSWRLLALPLNGYPYRWPCLAKTFLLPLLLASPFFSLVAYVRPQGIPLHATELLWPHQLRLHLLYLCRCSLHPSTNGFFFDPLHPMNRCQAIAIAYHC